MNSNVVVIGGGIVGLSTAWQLLNIDPNITVTVLEKEKSIASHQTGNNSGVIHSGIYYKPGSLKAENCIRGYHMLLEFCKEEEIPFDLCGKIIVATSQEEFGALENIYQRGIQNGLSGLRYLTKEEILAYEPHCSGLKGIFVPQTGIVNYKLVSEHIAKRILNSGRGQILTGEKVVSVTKTSESTILHTEKNRYQSTLAINCAGLYCDKIASMAGEQLPVKIIPFRGEYYSIKPEKAHLVKNLIYPVPDPNFPFLGVHFTRRITGEIEAGPNAVFAFRREGYTKSSFNWRALPSADFKK
ncbi:MAG: L-2-hydroxyglutarate oxidase [Flavobacterium stagni]